MDAVVVTRGVSMTRFRSKIDTWLVVLLGAAFLVGPLLVLMQSRGGGVRAWIANLAVVVAVSVPPAAITIWLFRTTDYTITEPDLLIRSGPVRWTVPLASIHSVRPTRSLLSAPALSTDRLEIRYGTWGVVVISPEDKRAFAIAIRARVPSVDVSGLDQ